MYLLWTDGVGGWDADKRIVSGCESQLQVSIAAFHNLYVNAFTKPDGNNKKKVAEITLNGIIAHHGWAAEQND